MIARRYVVPTLAVTEVLNFLLVLGSRLCLIVVHSRLSTTTSLR